MRRRDRVVLVVMVFIGVGRGVVVDVGDVLWFKSVALFSLVRREAGGGEGVDTHGKKTGCSLHSGRS